MSLSDGTYNGWRNWATWNVAVWVNNQEQTYRARLFFRPFSEELTVAFVRALFPCGTPDMEGHDALSRVDWEEIAEAFDED